MAKMKHNGGGQLLLLLLSIVLTVVLTTCGSSQSPFHTKINFELLNDNDYRIDILPPRDSTLLPFSFDVTDVIKKKQLIIPESKNLDVLVTYKQKFNFFVKADVPNSIYEFTSMEEINKPFNIHLPRWDVIISIFPINSNIPPLRTKVNLRNTESVTISYPDPEYVRGYLSITDVTFPIEGYRIILKTSDGFTSGNSLIVDGKFKIPIIPSEKYTFITLYNESEPFFPVFTLPINLSNQPIKLYLKGLGKAGSVTIFENFNQKLPYFLSAKGESIYSLSTSSSSVRGEVSGSFLVTSMMYQIRLLSGYYKLFMTPSSTSGFASYVTNVSSPLPGELNIHFPPTSLVNLIVSNSQGKPLKGAEVDLEPVPIIKDLQVLPVSGFTDSTGKVTLPLDTSFPFTFYLIRVLPPENYPGPGTLIIISSQSLITIANSNTSFSIPLPAFVLKKIQVVDSQNNPVKNAVVLMTSKTFGLNIFKGTTNSNGFITIPLLQQP